jgi:hypothetical protein
MTSPYLTPGRSDSIDVRISGGRVGTETPTTPAADSSDWRLRMTAPAITLAGILSPLAATAGVIFPYTPTIRVQYTANYSDYAPLHTNTRGLFYTSSQVENVMVEGTFTAQDSKEADYVRAAIHFFKSATKSFAHNSKNKGAPPPIVFMYGYGDLQFNRHPTLVSLFNYASPNDVDFIPTTDQRDMIPTQTRLSLTLMPLVTRTQMMSSNTGEYQSGAGIRQGYW